MQHTKRQWLFMILTRLWSSLETFSHDFIKPMIAQEFRVLRAFAVFHCTKFIFSSIQRSLNLWRIFFSSIFHFFLSFFSGKYFQIILELRFITVSVPNYKCEKISRRRATIDSKWLLSSVRYSECLCAKTDTLIRIINGGFVTSVHFTYLPIFSRKKKI